MFTLLAGLSAGFIHVLSGPDHLAAVAPLAVKKPRGSWNAGFRWGLGHTAGVAVVGVLALALRETLPLEPISNASERFVGVLLIAIGAWALRKALQIHSHPHQHEGEAGTHEHIHMHGKKESHSTDAPAFMNSAAAAGVETTAQEPGQTHHQTPHLHNHAAFGIGTLHGLAGSSHFLGILPALALPSTALAVGYLVAFGVGTIVAMMCFSQAIGVLAARFQMRMWRAYRALMFACSAVAMIVGVAWLTGSSF